MHVHMHVRALVHGDVIESAALRHNMAYHEFFNSIKFGENKLPYNQSIILLIQPKVECNGLMHEPMFQPDVSSKCKGNELAKQPCNNIILFRLLS